MQQDKIFRKPQNGFLVFRSTNLTTKMENSGPICHKDMAFDMLNSPLAEIHILNI